MDRKEFKKILGGSFSFGLVALGAYNLYWFVYYFMHGRDISIIPPKMQLLIVDIAVLVLITVTVMLFEVILSKQCGKKCGKESDDSSGSENK